MAAQSGIVYVVGAGPDVAGLLTVRGMELLALADSVVYERRAQRKLIPGEGTGGPKRFYVGPRGGIKRTASIDVQRLLVELAREGQRVVYLIHGDPFALGKGSTLVQALHDAEVEFEIVPGISVGNSAATYSGIPLMSPTLASATIFASGGGTPRVGIAPVDWSAVALVGGTVVVRDARRALPAIVAGFATAGVPGEIPAAAISHSGQATQQTVVGTLGSIERDMLRAGISGSVTLVIGWTVLLREEFAWFETRSLFGVRIVLAQERHASIVLRDRLRELGAMLLDLPQPRVARLDRDALRAELERISEYEWMVFASSDAVEIFWEQLLASGRDTRALANARVACVGAATAAALLDRGITVDVVQTRFEATALIDALAERADIPGAVLLYVADDATAESFGRDLEQSGAVVTSVPVYREIPDPKPEEAFRRRLESRRPDLALATSATAAESYVRVAGPDLLAGVPAATTDAVGATVLRDAGLNVVIDSPNTIDALVAAITLRFARDPVSGKRAF